MCQEMNEHLHVFVRRACHHLGEAGGSIQNIVPRVPDEVYERSEDFLVFPRGRFSGCENGWICDPVVDVDFFKDGSAEGFGSVVANERLKLLLEPDRE